MLSSPCSKTRNRVRHYLCLLMLIRAASSAPAKYLARQPKWQAQAVKLADLLQRNFGADLADATLKLEGLLLPWLKVRVKPVRLERFTPAPKKVQAVRPPPSTTSSPFQTPWPTDYME